MSFNDREERILDILRERNTVRCSELAKLLYVSVSTLRRDLEKLENKDFVVHEHGICRLSSKLRDEKYSYNMREQQNGIAKRKIAKAATAFIKDGSNIMLDGSSSAFALLPHFGEFRDLLVISNSAKVSYALSETGIYNISTGGKMANKTVSFVGQEAVNAVKKYNADLFFFSCGGMTEEGYLTDEDEDENEVRREMMRHATKRIALVDSSKIGKKFLYNICHVSEVDEVLCEEELPEYIKKQIGKA
jgi:DeoR/GlpR family transcriptional regulator of sugar metabolism